MAECWVCLSYSLPMAAPGGRNKKPQTLISKIVECWALSFLVSACGGSRWQKYKTTNSQISGGNSGDIFSDWRPFRSQIGQFNTSQHSRSSAIYKCIFQLLYCTPSVHCTVIKMDQNTQLFSVAKTNCCKPFEFNRYFILSNFWGEW